MTKSATRTGWLEMPQRFPLPYELGDIFERALRKNLRPEVCVELVGPRQAAENVLEVVAGQLHKDLDVHGLVPRLRFWRHGVFYVVQPAMVRPSP